MKINIVNNDIIIYLNKYYYKIFDIDNIYELEEYLSKILFRIKRDFKIDVNSYFKMEIIYDKIYGFILIMKKQNAEYFEMLNGLELDFSTIKMIPNLYELSDYFMVDKNIIANSNIYVYDGKLYLKLKKNINDFQMGLLLEVSNIIFGEKSENIIKNGNKIF